MNDQLDGPPVWDVTWKSNGSWGHAGLALARWRRGARGAGRGALHLELPHPRGHRGGVTRGLEHEGGAEHVPRDLRREPPRRASARGPAPGEAGCAARPRSCVESRGPSVEEIRGARHRHFGEGVLGHAEG